MVEKLGNDLDKVELMDKLTVHSGLTSISTYPSAFTVEEENKNVSLLPFLLTSTLVSIPTYQKWGSIKRRTLTLMIILPVLFRCPL